MGVSKKVTLDKDQKYTIGYSFKNKMGISANNFVILELIKDGSIMYTRKLQATEATTFDYTAPATGEYTWRMRSSSIGTTSTQPLTYSLDNLSIFYTYPYTIENCDNLADGYRFGFNGKEDDKEVEGQQDYGMRIYDNRIGRFKSVDPLTKEYPELTPYQFASNTPIQAIDLDGLEAYFIHQIVRNGRLIQTRLIRNEIYFGKVSTPNGRRRQDQARRWGTNSAQYTRVEYGTSNYSYGSILSGNQFQQTKQFFYGIGDGSDQITQQKLDNGTAYHDLKVGYNQSIYFPTNISQRDGQAITDVYIDNVVNMMICDPNATCIISGYTSKKGTEEDNKKLSEDRANYFKKQLTNKGISKERIETVGYGEKYATGNDGDGNSTGDDNEVDRRIDINVIPSIQPTPYTSPGVNE